MAERAAMAGEFGYQDFDLLVEPDAPGSYRARVLRSPVGESAPVLFTLPFTMLELENFVLKVGLVRRGTRGPGRPDSAPLKDFGGKLYSAVFQDELREVWQASLGQARAQGTGMRLRLRLSGAPELAGLPWEFLYDPRHNRFLAQSRHTPLVRYLDLPDPPHPVQVTGPLRLLVMISSPAGYPPLDVEHEWDVLTGALAGQQAEGRVVIERLAANMSMLQERLRREAFHVFHFIGHGIYRPDWADGVLVMEDRHGQPHEVPGEELGGLLNEYDPTRLAVLNACEGARTGASDPFAGIAQSLIQQGLPAVVAMQFEITDHAAIHFARGLYGAIADGYRLEAALAQARRAILHEGNPTEWATPVLYSRAPDGRLFDLTAQASMPQDPRQARDEPERTGPEQVPSRAAGPGEPDATAVLASARSTLPTRIVAPSGGHHTTIAAAITAAAPGDQIIIKPGKYHESLTIDKDLQIHGDGPMEKITVQSANAPAICLRAGRTQISNLTIRRTFTQGTQLAADDSRGAMQIEGGQPTVRDCDISTQAGNGLIVQGDADPVIRANRIHDNLAVGVGVTEQARGTFEDNDISANDLGVGVSGGADPTVRGNRIHGSKQVGVVVVEQGRGRFEDNDISANDTGVSAGGGADPTVRGNRIHDNKQAGVIVLAQGRGRFEDNDISANNWGVGVSGGADPTTVRGNRIHDNKTFGVMVVEQGRGTFEDNDISANHTGVGVGGGGDPTVRGNRIHDNRQAGVGAAEQGRGTFEDNDISVNNIGVSVGEGGDPTVRGNRIHDNRQAGVGAAEEGRGRFEDNDISANDFGVRVSGGADPTVRANRIHGNKHAAVMAAAQGRGTFEDNDISVNNGDGVLVKTSGNPVVRANRIHANKQNGVLVQEQGRGTFEDNDISANTQSGVLMKSGGHPSIRNNSIHKNRSSGVRVTWTGRGRITGNNIFSNTPSNLKISSASTVTQSGNRTTD